jgi:tetratricopeptide (TPR) repeat protein
MMVSGTLETAQSLHGQGRLAEAETLYREVLTFQPDAVPALAGLGVLAYQHGRADEAASLFARGVRIRPELATLRANLGEALRILKQYDEAADHLRRALTLDPDQPDAWNTQGLLALDLGRYAEAEEAFRAAIRLRPAFASAYINLGSALCESGRPDEAAEALRSALRIEPDNPAALTSLGKALIETEDPELLDEAESICRRALALAPVLPQAINNLGNVLRIQGRFGEARACYQRALQMDPCRIMPRLNLGRWLQECGRYEEAARLYAEAEALEPNPARYHANCGSLAAEREDHDEAARHYRLALAADPASAEAHHGLGLALLEASQFDAAEVALRAAIRLKPAYVASWVTLARLQGERGDFDSADQSARTALGLRPRWADAYCVLANQFRGRLPDADIQAMRGLLDRKDQDDRRRARLQFALAAVLDARGLHAQAAALLEDANARQATAWAARGQGYDPDEHARFIDRLIDTYTPEFLARNRSWGDPDPRPVFIVGLPRSGTTLIEQILASHPAVHGAGELPDVLRIFHGLPEVVGRPCSDPFAALHALGPDSARSAARRYLDRLATFTPSDAARVVDKMPDNIHLVGLIALLWPRARVIVCGRDLRDVAVSCWKVGFATVRWANDPDHIARRLADHMRLLEHWNRTRPLAWLDVSYEDVVDDLEGQARRLIHFLGLEWDPSCLAFHTTRRVVRTASLAQVRRPIYSDSVGRWRDYESLVPALFEALRRRGIDRTASGCVADRPPED